MKSEEDIQREREELELFKEKYGKQIEDYKNQINKMLELGSRDSRQLLVELFNNQDFLNIYCKDPDIAQMQVIMAIYQQETEQNIRHTILENMKTISQVFDYFTMFKFQLWRIEWDIPNAYEDFLKFIKEKQTSIVIILYMIHTTSINKVDTLFKLSFLFRKNGMDELALPCLKYANELQPDDSLILGEMAEICVKAGRVEMADLFIEQMKDENSSNEIDFIICSNNTQYLKECVFYIQKLLVPKGFCINIRQIADAKSMVEGYNRAMKQSNAKYRIYLHQDVFILNPYFIYEVVIRFLKDKEIGIIGMVGGINLPKDGCLFTKWNIGRLINANPNRVYELTGEEIKKTGIDTKVDAVDGLLIATQYDILWREDFLSSFDFYDFSQCFEYRRRGYKIVVPYQNQAWCFHDSGYRKKIDYNNERRKMIEEYPDFLENQGKIIPSYEELKEKCNYLLDCITKLLNEDKFDEMSKYLDQYEEWMESDELTILRIIYDCCQTEKKYATVTSFEKEKSQINELIQKYVKIKFFIHRIEFQRDIIYDEVTNFIKENKILPSAFCYVGYHSSIQFLATMHFLENYYQSLGQEKNVEIIRHLVEQFTKKEVEHER